MAIPVKWKFHEDFKSIFLDIWFEKSPEGFNQALEACDKVGNEMIVWLSDTNNELYKGIYDQAVKETQEEIVARRLEE